jgi:hypothetical protein
MKFATGAVASTALLAASVDAHGYLSQPLAKFAAGWVDTSFDGKIDSSTQPAPFAGKKWNDNPTNNAITFTAAFKQSKYKNLKEMLDPVGPTCGKTVLTGPAIDVSSMRSVKWQNDQERQGFVKSHTGPCEIWIDNTMIFHEDECVSRFPAYPAEIPVSFSACKGTCTLTFYWLALHEPQWQVYKQCALIKNGRMLRG